MLVVQSRHIYHLTDYKMNNNISKLIFLLKNDNNFKAIEINERSHCDYILNRIAEQTHASDVKELLLVLKKSFSENDVLLQYINAISNVFYIKILKEKEEEVISLCQLIINELDIQLLNNISNVDNSTIENIKSHLNNLIKDIPEYNYCTHVHGLIEFIIKEITNKNIKNKVVIEKVLHNIDTEIKSLINIKTTMILANSDLTKEYFKDE